MLIRDRRVAKYFYSKLLRGSRRIYIKYGSWINDYLWTAVVEHVFEDPVWGRLEKEIPRLDFGVCGIGARTTYLQLHTYTYKSARACGDHNK